MYLETDGTYREFTVENGKVICTSRSGKSYDYPAINSVLVTYPDGRYIGELAFMFDGVVLDRTTSSGILNSDNVPHSNLILSLWDYATPEEYTTIPYRTRIGKLLAIVGNKISTMPPQIRVLETRRFGI